MLGFFITVPTWFSEIYPTDDSAWYIYDISSVLRISIFPLAAVFLAKSRLLKFMFGAYFALTLTNILTLSLNYTEVIKEFLLQTQIGSIFFDIAQSTKSWTMEVQIGIASIILLDLIIKWVRLKKIKVKSQSAV